MSAPHALYSKMLAERTASRNVLVLLYFILSLGYNIKIHGDKVLKVFGTPRGGVLLC